VYNCDPLSKNRYFISNKEGKIATKLFLLKELKLETNNLTQGSRKDMVIKLTDS